MSELIHVRPAEKDRPKPPTLHDQEVTLQEPPETPRRAQTTWGVFGPALLIGGLLGMVFVGFRNGSSFSGGWMSMPMMMGMGMMLMFRRRGGQGQGDIQRDRVNYARYLDAQRDAAIASARTQFEVAEFHYPPPDVLASLIGPGRRPEGADENKPVVGEREPVPGERMWERRRDGGAKGQFGHVRIGIGEERARLKYNTVELGALIDQEPACAQMMTDLMAEQSFVRDIPRAISLADHPALFCVGDQQLARSSVRAMLMHAAFFHNPQDLGIAVITNEEAAPRWDWVKWLPHHREDNGLGMMTYASALDFVAALGESYTSRGVFNANSVRQSSIASAAGVSSQGAGQGAGRLLIVVCDGGSVDWPYLLRAAQGMSDSGVEGVCFVVLGEDGSPLRTPTRTLTYERPARVLRSETDKDAPSLLAVPDRVPVWEAEAFARRLAAWRPGTKASALLDTDADSSPKLRLGSLIGIEDWANFNPAETWQWAKNRRNLLRVPVGQFIDSGRPWFLDMTEDANAHGPHFGLGGSTGSGKSEFLRVLVLALCCTHSPQDLVIIPADFKGNITFRGFEELPHVPMVLNNLESNPDSVQRLIHVLMGELERRQRMLDDAGVLASKGVIQRAPVNIYEYRALCAKRPDLNLPTMPHLFIPFDELMQAKRTFPELLSIMRITGTVGRSLGVHMAPVSQTLDDSLMAGIGTHLTARIGLKMNDPKDYRPILGTSNPGALPARKGVGYFVPNLDSPAQRVQVAYVSGTYVPPDAAAAEAEQTETASEAKPRVLSGFKTAAVTAIERVFGTQAGPAEAAPEVDDVEVDDVDEPGEDADDEVGEDIASTDMGVAIQVLKAHGGVIDHIPWLPELLSYSPVFDAVATYIREVQPELAAGFLDWDQGHPGRYVPDLVRNFTAVPLTPMAPCGVIDRPRDHAQDVLKINLGHNTAIAGAADAGKSYALLSTITASSTLYSPEQVQFYCLDLGGGELGWLRGLDHVGTVISGDGDVYGIGRMISHVQHIMNRRSSTWAAARINTVDEWRQKRFGGDPAAAATVPDDGYGDVYLVINGFDKFFNAFFDQHGQAITQIAQSGPDRGVHLVVTVNTWTARHTYQLWDHFKDRYELRLDEFNNSLMGATLAQTVPQFPGRGMITVSGASRARRGAIQVQGTDTVPPEPITWHVLFSEPGVVTARGERVALGAETGEEVAWFVNALHPGSRKAQQMPELPPRIQVSEIMASHPPAKPGQILLGIQETDTEPYYWSPDIDPHLIVLGGGESGRSTVLRLIGGQLQRRIESAPDGEKPLVFVFDQAQATVGAVMGGEFVYQPSQVPAAVEKIKAVLASRNTDEELTQAELLARRSAGRRFEGPEVFVIVDNLTDFINPLDPFNWNDLIEKGKMIGFHVIVSRVADTSVVGDWAGGRSMLAIMKRTNTPVLLMSSPPELINVVGKLRGQVLPQGRGMMVTRTGTTMIQTAIPDNEPWLLNESAHRG